MADTAMDEDTPINSLHNISHCEDNDLDDEFQDFRFLASLSKSHQIPKRGEKDFEPHGTKHQDTMLEASRQAMHEVLSYTRVHIPKSNCRAWYFGDGVEGAENILIDAVRGRGLDKDHVVMVEHSRGVHFRSMGKTAQAILPARMWLLPEEALYLIERGNLDMWWPARPLDAIRGHVREQGTEESDEDDDDGLPLSLEAAYALLIGEDGERGKVSLDKYIVFANLKRTGYVVFRDRNDNLSLEIEGQDLQTTKSTSTPSLFTWLVGTFFSGQVEEHTPYGPLVKLGLYRSYNSIYQQLSIIPRYMPMPLLKESLTSPQDPFCIVYHIWKPSRIPPFAKSNPGEPDFRIAVLTARSTAVPTLMQLTAILESTPWDPPPKEWTGLDKSYQRLKHGWRNAVLAVVDHGIISYLRVSEAAFAEEKLYERFDKTNHRGGKRGGGRGKGRGKTRAR